MRALVALIAVLFWIIPFQPASAASCQFILGFKAIHDAMPDQIGDCLVNEHYDAAGDAVQETTGPAGAGGLLVWRRLDNWTAYTDGYHTWIHDWLGFEERLNSQRFYYEIGTPVIVNNSVVELPVVVTPQQIDFCHGLLANLTNAQRAQSVYASFCADVMTSPPYLAVHPTVNGRRT